MWNYRVLKEDFEVKGKNYETYRVIEVFYEDDGTITGWVDCTHDILSVTNDDGVQAYQDLKGSAEHVLDAFKLPVVAKDKNNRLIEVGEKRYIVTDDIDEATHWIAREDEKNDVLDVTIGKAYQLIFDENENEHHIIDDFGDSSLIYIVHKGDYVYFK